MRAVHGEHLKPLTLDVAHPTGDLRGRAVPRDADRILVRRQPRFACGERANRTKAGPRLPVGAPARWPEERSHDRDAHEGGTGDVQPDVDPEQEPSAVR